MIPEPFTVYNMQYPNVEHGLGYGFVALVPDARLNGPHLVDITILVLPRQPTPDELAQIKAVMADK